MIYQAHIEHVGPHVADGLADNLLITFRADGPADCHALQALLELGHLTLVFDSASTPRHQGTLHLAGKVPALALLQGYLIVKESAQ